MVTPSVGEGGGKYPHISRVGVEGGASLMHSVVYVNMANKHALRYSSLILPIYSGEVLENKE